MSTLTSGLRAELERVVIDARDAAEVGARAALEALTVHHKAPYPHMRSDLRQLRNQLRAKARQLGDRRLPRVAADGKDHEIDHLVAECAYEHWHRMLFGRFLAENDLLIEPQEKMAISLAEAKELAKDEGVDMWVFTSRCAQGMLPQIFRPDDPLLQVAFATEYRLELESLLASLSEAVFTASDALGWVYQFWQSKKKVDVKRSEVKIGADEVAAVTQLFTEPYMVEFLLHNTLGAWWAGRRLSSEDAVDARTEDELRQKLSLPGVDWQYLRFVRGTDDEGGPWRPAAGIFDGWPKTAADLKVLDPCCGSGHFLVAAFLHLVPIRMAEESLSAPEAVDAVLRDNLHGLEIDERCCQIAAFALALSAWTYPEAGSYRLLPNAHIACTGIAPHASKAEWLELAEKAAAKGHLPAKRDLLSKEESLLSMTLSNAMEFFFDLFVQAPTLGSLVNPRSLSADLYQSGYEALTPLLSEILSAETNGETRERAIAAAGMVKAAGLLVDEYTLVVTNVPYLGRGKQNEILKSHLERRFNEGKADLATAFVLRCMELCDRCGSVALVTQQNWWFLSTYRSLRQRLLTDHSWQLVVALGEEAWQSFGARGPVAALSILANTRPDCRHAVAGIDALSKPDISRKIREMASGEVRLLPQAALYDNPDHRITVELVAGGALLQRYAAALQGVSPADLQRFGRAFWEVCLAKEWRFWQGAVEETKLYGGRSLVLWWNQDLMDAVERGHAFIRGHLAWNKMGVACRQMRDLPATIYGGELFDTNTAVIVPSDPAHLPALWCFCSSSAFLPAIRRIDKKVNVTNASFGKVSFDLAHWQVVARREYPGGLPEPESDDPTQWLFHGWPQESTAPLHVAVARLLGFRWPAEADREMRLSRRARGLAVRCEELSALTDGDGIICIGSVRGEEAASDRLLGFLAHADVTSQQARELGGEPGP